MVPLALAVVFGLAVAASGRAVASRIDATRPPRALGASVALAAIVVISADIAAHWRFAAWLPLVIWGSLLGLGIVVRSPVRQHVPDPARLVILGFAAVISTLPLLVLPVPLDTDQQGFGHLALAMRDGGTLDTLAPWRPAIAYLYAPGALMLSAALSALTGTSVVSAMMGIGHAVAVLVVWLAWELGDEIQRHMPGSRPGSLWPRAVSAGACFSAGLWTALLDSHLTAIVALLFITGLVVATMRYYRTGALADLAAMTLTLAAVPVTHSDSTTIVAFGVLAFALLARAGRGGPPPGRWAIATAVPPLMALVLAGPWLLSLAPMLETGIRSPFDVSLTHIRVLILFHGIVWPLLALAGLVFWWRQRPWWAFAMAGWLAAVVQSSLFGWLEAALPWPLDLLARFAYPYSVAWHGPIVPYFVLGSAALVWLAQRRGLTSLPLPGARTLLAAAAAGLLLVATSSHVLALSRPVVHFYGAFSSHNDVRAMHWIRDHTPRGARVLNYPGNYGDGLDWEGHWAPVLTERDCVYFRMQPFFMDGPADAAGEHAGGNLADAYREQRRLLAFWRDPANPAHETLLRDARIDYVLAPEWLADGDSLERAWRWRPPSRLDDVRSSLEEASYLRPAYEAGGARVYAVAPADGPTWP